MNEPFDYSFLFKCDHEIGGRCTRDNNEIGKCCYQRDGSCGKAEGGRTVEDVLDGYRRELATAWRYTPDDGLVDVEDEITARYADELREML